MKEKFTTDKFMARVSNLEPNLLGKFEYTSASPEGVGQLALALQHAGNQCLAQV